MSNYNRITFKERVRIEAGIYAGKSFSRIAKELGRSTSSITREVKQNRIQVHARLSAGKDCILFSECQVTGLCEESCESYRCRMCRDHDCTEHCSKRIPYICKRTEKAPYVCEGCAERSKKNCRFHKYYYLAEKADAKAMKKELNLLKRSLHQSF